MKCCVLATLLLVSVAPAAADELRTVVVPLKFVASEGHPNFDAEAIQRLNNFGIADPDQIVGMSLIVTNLGGALGNDGAYGCNSIDVVRNEHGHVDVGVGCKSVPNSPVEQIADSPAFFRGRLLLTIRED